MALEEAIGVAPPAALVVQWAGVAGKPRQLQPGSLRQMCCLIYLS